MDGTIIAVISDAVLTTAVVVTGLWKVHGKMSDKIGKQSREIGEMQGEFKGFKDTMQAVLDAHGQRISRLEDIENGSRLIRKRREA